FVDGVSIPDSACFQQDAITRAGPSARLPDPMNPVIVLQDSHPILASSCIGASLHELTIQSLINVLDFGMYPKKVTQTPAFMLPEWTGLLRVLGARSKYVWAVAQWYSWLITYFARFIGGSPKIFALKQMIEPGDFSQALLESVAAMGQRFK